METDKEAQLKASMHGQSLENQWTKDTYPLCVWALFHYSYCSLAYSPTIEGVPSLSLTIMKLLRTDMVIQFTTFRDRASIRHLFLVTVSQSECKYWGELWLNHWGPWVDILYSTTASRQMASLLRDDRPSTDQCRRETKVQYMIIVRHSCSCPTPAL